MTREKANLFRSLHRRGDPLLLFNIWDAGSAKAVDEAGAVALATGSWSVAAAQGYEDGEKIPLELLETLVARMAQATDLPLSVDIEGGYGETPDAVAATAERMMAAGAIGINFEDQVVGGKALFPIERQVARIAAIRAAADRSGVPLFINARTDLFLKQADRAAHPALLQEVIARGMAYAEAGADGFFVPAAADDTLIAAICDAVPLPVNVMMMAGVPNLARLTALGVARLSFGPGPYRNAMAGVGQAAGKAFSAG